MLSGERACLHSDGVHVVELSLKRGDALLVEPNASVWCDETQSCEALSVIVFPDFLRFTCKRLEKGAPSISVLYCGHCVAKSVKPLLEHARLLFHDSRRPEGGALRKLLLSELETAIRAPLPEFDGEGGGSFLLSELSCYVQEHLREGLSCARLAAAFKISPNYVSQLFIRGHGKGFSEYVSEARLELAAALLEESKLSVKQVSGYCGFTRENYFIRVFKSRYSATPVKYRQQWSGTR